MTIPCRSVKAENGENTVARKATCLFIRLCMKCRHLHQRVDVTINRTLCVQGTTV